MSVEQFCEHDLTDDEVSAILIDNPRETKSSNTGLIVRGEDSESEEEEINLTDKNSLKNANSKRGKILKQILPKAEKIDLNIEEKSIKYNSLLHKKLRDKNVNFNKNLNDLIDKPFNSAVNGISNVSQQMIKTHMSIQDLWPMLRQLSNKLFNLEDKVDFLCDYTQHLPEIEIIYSKN